MDILLVVDTHLLPTSHGGQIDQIGMFEEFRKLGHSTDLICTTNLDSCQTKKLDKNFTSIKRSYSLINIFNLLPFQVTSRKELSRIKLSKKYDVVIFSELCQAILQNKTLSAQHFFIRRHNIESKYALGEFYKAKNFKKIFYLKEYISWLILEKLVYKKLEHIRHLFVSNDELLNVKKKCDIQAIYLPVINNFRSAPKSEYTLPLKIGFVGSLVIQENLMAAKELIDLFKINTKYKIFIGGRYEQGLPDLDNTSISFFPNFKDTDNIWDKFNVFIISRSHSVGVKVKAIEALSRGKLLICCKEVLIGLPKKLHRFCFIIEGINDVFRTLEEIESYGEKKIKKLLFEMDQTIIKISPNKKLEEVLNHLR